MKKIIALLILIFPWSIRRYLYQIFFGYKIDKTSYIGYSLLFPEKLIMKKNSRIGHLNICKKIDALELDENAILENLNWITGFPSQTNSNHFSHQANRFPALIIKEHAAITSRHSIDCTDTIIIGSFSTIAGARSQLLTHSINLALGKQECSKIIIGKYNFLGTNCVILKGCETNDYNIFGASSLLNKKYIDKYILNGGIPAKQIKTLPEDWKYFTRTIGSID